jgi:hypothetical protein
MPARLAARSDQQKHCATAQGDLAHVVVDVGAIIIGTAICQVCDDDRQVQLVHGLHAHLLQELPQLRLV